MYLKDKYHLSNLKFYINELTMVLNYLLKFLIIYIADRIGYESETLKSERICRFIFLMLYFNTGWIIILADASFKKQGLFFSNAFDGQRSDFDMEWQKQQGVDILIQMSFNIIMPLLYEAAYYLKRLF